jgi:hypothetical protein
MISSQFENFAQALLDDNPFGSVVTGSALTKFAKEYSGNGASPAAAAALKADLAIDDPAKRISTLRRHINHGGTSDNISEDRRFVLAVEDAKRKTFTVRAYADHVLDTATAAIGKSVNGALSPLKNQQKAINSVKLDELPEIMRQTLETARENIEHMEMAVKPTYAQEVSRIWIAAMERRGISADVAEKIRLALPEVTKLQKLLGKTR